MGKEYQENISDLESPNPAKLSDVAAWDKLLKKLLAEVSALEALDALWLRWELQEEGKIILIDNEQKRLCSSMRQVC